jgi:hypothetical protein
MTDDPGVPVLESAALDRQVSSQLETLSKRLGSGTRRSQSRQRGKHCDALQLRRLSKSPTSLGPAVDDWDAVKAELGGSPNLTTRKGRPYISEALTVGQLTDPEVR